MDKDSGLYSCHTVRKMSAEIEEHALDSIMSKQGFLENEIENFKSGA